MKNSKVKGQRSKLQFKTKKYVVGSGKKRIELKNPDTYRVELVEEGAEVEISGVFVGRGDDETEVKVVIVHKAPHTRANTTLKGAAYDRSKLKFDGKIVVEKDCPDTNSFLTEKILLLGEEAKAEAVPDLEIESDDVRCSHAATISRIPEEQVFYLMSRGLGRGKAEEMIVEGFLGLV